MSIGHYWYHARRCGLLSAQEAAPQPAGFTVETGTGAAEPHQ